MKAYLLRLEGPRTALALFLGLMLGGVLGSLWLGFSLALLGLLGTHLWHAAVLLVWLQKPKKRDLPDGSGIWADIYTLSLERHRQARRRKKRLGGIVKEFRASTGALPDAAVVLDSDGCIVWFNQAAVALLALRGQKDVGQRVSNLLRHPEFNSYFRTHQRSQQGVEIPAPGNAEQTLWIRVIPYGEGQRLLIARDVTELKRLEESRRDFVANASHELRTPLTVLRGYLDLMGEDPGDTGGLVPWREPIAEMRRQAARMQGIIADMLKLARLESAAVLAPDDLVDMPAVIGAAMEEAEALSNGRHRLICEVDQGLQLSGNRAELHSIVGNLLSNALRYTPEGGEVTLRWQRHDDAAVLSVTDSGIGIAARDIPRLTERFYRADIARSRETGGTGLGLAIVKHALERHEARLDIDSQPGRGSCFRCHFPRRRIVQAAAAAPEKPSQTCISP